LLGSLSYGLSITLFIHAMRGLGASRASTLFGISPLAGIALSIVLLHETPNSWFVIALIIMVAGTLFLIFENHSHKHLHLANIHEHAHIHEDGHHTHDHDESLRIHEGQSHSHIHEHKEIEHDHEHMPDINHRHNHVD
ncbi:MAG: EamA family transporter, partial [Firmicutes bacterium HGW-Firmicutes-18]